MPMIQTVSWDAFGTLIMPVASIGTVYAAIAAERGLELPGDAMDAAFVPAFRAVRARWSVPYGSDAEDAWRFWSAVLVRVLPGNCDRECRRAIFDDFGHGRWWRVLPGVRDSLRILRERGCKLAVCSNFDHRLHRILADLALHDFDCIVVSAELGAAKPDARMLMAVAEQCDCPPTAIMHIGDHGHEDGGVAAAVGAQYLPVTRGEGVRPEAVLAAVDAAHRS